MGFFKLLLTDHRLRFQKRPRPHPLPLRVYHLRARQRRNRTALPARNLQSPRNRRRTSRPTGYPRASQLDAHLPEQWPCSSCRSTTDAADEGRENQPCFLAPSTIFRKVSFEAFTKSMGPVILMKTSPCSLSSMAPCSIWSGIAVLAPPGMPLI